MKIFTSLLIFLFISQCCVGQHIEETWAYFFDKEWISKNQIETIIDKMYFAKMNGKLARKPWVISYDYLPNGTLIFSKDSYVEENDSILIVSHKPKGKNINKKSFFYFYEKSFKDRKTGLIKWSEGYNSKTYYSYDSLGKLTESLHINNSLNNINHFNQFYYDTLGRLDSICTVDFRGDKNNWKDNPIAKSLEILEYQSDVPSVNTLYHFNEGIFSPSRKLFYFYDKKGFPWYCEYYDVEGESLILTEKIVFEYVFRKPEKTHIHSNLYLTIDSLIAENELAHKKEVNLEKIENDAREQLSKNRPFIWNQSSLPPPTESLILLEGHLVEIVFLDKFLLKDVLEITYLEPDMSRAIWGHRAKFGVYSISLNNKAKRKLKRLVKGKQ